MGLMNKMRDKTHIILIVLILAFLATIIFDWGMGALGLKSTEVTQLGYVNGEAISSAEFENQVQFAVEQQKQQTGEEPDETLIQMMRDQVWDQMVTQILAKQQIEKLGIKVTDQEIINWVYNSPQTLPDVIKRNFMDSTGQFNMSIYQQALATKTPEVQKFWSQVEDYLKQTLLSQKLQSVITSVVRIPENDVLQKYKDENIYANFDFVFLDVSAVSDAQIQITDDDLRAYYEKHKDDFRSEEQVKLKYVLFSDSPTMEDTLLTEKQLRALRKDLKKMNDSDLINLVNTNSEAKWSDKFVKPSELSPQVANFLFAAGKDSVSDAILASDGFHIVRLLDSREGENVYTNASHILVNFGTDTNAAKLKAAEIYRRAKAGEDFSKLASDLSDDPGSKVRGGNLGWFTKGAMVKEFEEAAVIGKPGEIVGPIKTKFGFHIIKIHDRRKREFKIADIKKSVKTSAKTRDAVRKRAEDFAFVARKGDFEDEARKLNIQVNDIQPITKNSFIPGAGQNKRITKFAFAEKKKNVSDPFKIQSGYAIYVIADKISEGYMRLEDVTETAVKPKVILEKKLDIIKQKAQDLYGRISGNSLVSLKNADPSINVQSSDSVSVTKPSPTVGLGNDPDFNNAVFNMQKGQISQPVRTARGYYIVQVRDITTFDPEKYKSASDAIRASMLSQKKQTIIQDWITELKETADITDNRDKFYR